MRACVRACATCHGFSGISGRPMAATRRQRPKPSAGGARPPLMKTGAKWKKKKKKNPENVESHLAAKRAWAACGQRPRAVIDCVGGDPLPTEGEAPRGRSNTPPRAWCARRQRKQSRTPCWQVAPCFASCARHACGRRRRAGAGAGGHACGDTYAPQALPRAQGPRGGGTSHQINSPGGALPSCPAGGRGRSDATAGAAPPAFRD